jgi:hypothetical protein
MSNSLPTILKAGTFKYYDGKAPSKQVAINILMSIFEDKKDKVGIENKIYILKGRTGSGKSTVLPYYLFDSYLKKGHSVWSTQPRIILAQENSRQITSFYKLHLGIDIGSITGHSKNKPRMRNHILFTTIKILARKLLSLINNENRLLTNPYKVFIIDEVHEIDLPTMETLKIIKMFLAKYANKTECPLFIFSSATLDEIALVNYFFIDDANLSEKSKAIKLLQRNHNIFGYVEGEANYPVTKYYLEDKDIRNLAELERRDSNAVMIEGAKYYIENILPKQVTSNNSIEITEEIVIAAAADQQQQQTTKTKSFKKSASDGLIIIPSPKNDIPLIGRIIFEFLKKNNKYSCFLATANNSKFHSKEYVEGNTSAILKEFRQNNGSSSKKYFVIIGYASGYSTLGDYIIGKNNNNIPNEIKIYVSSPVVETGMTISTIEFILDFGLQTSPFYFPLVNFKKFKIIPIDKDKLTQREGRVGRRTKGEFHHLYSKKITASLPQSISQTINTICLSHMFVQLFERNKVIDLVNLNNLFLPTSIDILITTSQDLMKSFIIGPHGENYNRDTDIHNILINYFMYNHKKNLLEACLLAYSNWRQMKIQKFNIYNYETLEVDSIKTNFRSNLFNTKTFSPTDHISMFIPTKTIEDFKETITESEIDFIREARNTFTNILTRNREPD